MSLGPSLARGAVSLGGARIIGNLLGAISIVILARLLTPTDFGIVAIASSILSIVQSCTELSLANALIQKRDVQRSHIDTAWTMSLLRSLALILVLAMLAWPLAEIYRMPNLIPVILVSGLTGAAAGLQNPLISLATKDMRFGPIAVSQLAQKALSFAFAVVLALMLRSYWAIIAGNALGAVLASLLTYFIVPYRPRFDLSRLREIWSFSGWLFLKQLCETLNWRADQLIIGTLVSKPQLGVYAMADSLAVIPSRETLHPIRQALYPGLAIVNGNDERLRSSTLRAQATLAMVVAPLGIMLALVAEPAIRIALGDQWRQAVPFVQISALLYSFGCFSVGLQPVAMAVGRTKILFVLQAIVLLVKLPMLVAGFIVGGLLGTALARCLVEFLAMMLELVAIRILVGITVGKQIHAHAATIAGLVAMSVVVTQVHRVLAASQDNALVQFGIEVITGIAVYGATVLGLWLASGKRLGPVDELLHVAGRLLARFRPEAPQQSVAKSGAVGQ
ncbi:MAG: lipopolysaccharide biosynthesis protein [Novosphingobium sp.]